MTETIPSALSIESLHKTYANGFEALKGISLDVKQGDFFALLGPNGAGKSTTIGIITSLVNKTSGKVEVFGDNIDTQLEDAKRHIGLVPQEFNFSIFEPVMQIVINQAGYYGVDYHTAKKRADKYLSQLGLWEKRNVRARMLSGGMKRRLMIARALIHEPELLILDEPTAGVDIEIRRSMWEFLTEVNHNGKTVILTTHYLEEAEQLCRNIAIIDHGHIVEHSDMKSLLEKLHTETFILYTQNNFNTAPKLINFNCELIDHSTLAIDVSNDQQMNDLFTEFDNLGIKISSMRNKSNRLEELFVKLTTRESD